MDSVTATGTVRRTVRVAIALLASQALLCGLIGWLTLGRRDAGETVDQMAAPPPVPTPAVTGSFTVPPPSPPPTTTRPAPTRTTSPPETDVEIVAPTTTRAAPRTPPPVPTSPVDPPAVPVVSLPTSTPTSTPGPTLSLDPPRPPDASTSPGVPDPVVAGERCGPEWAWGTTADGTLARCLRTWRHGLRWKIF